MAEEHREKATVIERTPVPRILLARMVFYAADVIAVLLAARFFLKAIQADPQGGFVDLIYRLSDTLVSPFERIFPPAAVAGLVLEWSTLLAMLVVMLLAMLVVRLLRVLNPHS